jgi:hypothetical protein
MNAYQKEQWEGYSQIFNQLKRMSPNDRTHLKNSTQTYIRFRQDLDRFQSQYFAMHCTQSCFQSSISACCSKDGIITFWADLVINAVHSNRIQMNQLMNAIEHPHQPTKCIYLQPRGCVWHIRPLVCAMFLCDSAAESVFTVKPKASGQWQQLKEKGRGFRWPDRTVLFDTIEQSFIALGCRSPLMYLNSSPGLLRVKQKAGLPAQRLI